LLIVIVYRSLALLYLANTAKKKKKEKSTPKEKPPVDVEKQCGVPLPNGDLCARSLTCKSHSMGAKRAVQGRSQPYDVLLASYQKKNQVKLATLSAQNALDEENEAFKDEVVDDNEEFAQVMAGVQRSYPVPVEQKVVMPTRLKNDFFRMREMLIGTLTNVASVPPPSTGASSSASQIMSATGAVLGRTVVYEPGTGNSFVRPSRAVRRR
jgi:SAGA-associated factor 73